MSPAQLIAGEQPKTMQALCTDKFDLSFNQQDRPNQPVETALDLTKAFYLLVNVDEHPEVLPFAHDHVSRQLAAPISEFDDLLRPAPKVDWQEQLYAMKDFVSARAAGYETPLQQTAAGQRSAIVMHFYLQYLPMALVDGCWLQNGSRVATAHTRIGSAITGLYQHQVRAFVADPGRHFVSDYKAAFNRIVGTIEDVSSHSFAERDDIAKGSFELPLFLLSIAQFTRTFAPEIIGVNLAWQYLALPSFGPNLITEFCDTHGLPRLGQDLVDNEYLTKGVNMANEAAMLVLNEATPDRKDEVWGRIVRGAASLTRLWHDWHSSTLEVAPIGPPDPRQRMIDLMWKKASHARGYHGRRPLGDKLIDEYFNPDTFSGPALLKALANSPWVRPGQSGKSPLLKHLIGFGGPMLGVFSPSEQQIIRDWIDSLPQREGRNRPLAGDDSEIDFSGDDLKPSERLRKHITARLWSPREFRERSDAVFGECSTRELYHYLVNVEQYPEILPVAERFARDRLERSLASMWTGERPIPSTHYSPEALEYWVDKKHREQVDAYRPPSQRPEVAKEDFVEATVQLAPIILIDGAWLQGIASPALIHTTVGRMLFHVFVEEIGEGNAAEHHANVYRDLLAAMGLSAPPVESKEFMQWDRLEDESFEVPALWLAISCFPRHFMPEILGLNLAVELAGVGAPYMEARDTLRRFRYPTLFVDMHNAADNVTAGHSAWAMNTIKRYMDELVEREGPHHLDQHWHRVWSGVRATLPQIGRLQLLAHRAKRRLFGQDPRFVPLIFPT